MKRLWCRLVYIGLSCLALALPAGVRGQDAASTAATAAEAEEEMPAVNIRVVVTEAARPEWEQTLSPGSVDVIIPDDFKGEQKKLPEYLDMVPGLHVERRGGEGQYSTATMRGSTSAQVNIYVDGVPQNLGLDGAIDLSLIPMDNVARIEVYRGYAPARFSGAPIGGVINIVTKKPQGFGFDISAGAKSLTGRNADATVTAPLLGGSLLLGFHRDQSDGDFGYEYTTDTPPNAITFPDCGVKTPCTRTRKSNQHKETDALLKWQDANWHFKYAWKETSRFYPNMTNLPTSMGSESVIDYEEKLQGAHNAGYNTFHRYQKSDQHDLLLGRRQSWRNLELGVEANWTKQDKFYDIMDFKWEPEIFDKAYARIGNIWNRYLTKRYGVNVDGSYKLGERQLLEFRADFFNEKLDMDGNKDRTMDGGGYSNVTGKPQVYKRDTWHIQASDTFTLNDAGDLKLTLIARWDKAQDKSIDSPNYYDPYTDNASGIGTWGVAVKKEVGGAWTFRGTGGSYVRYPNFYELYGDGVNVVPGMAGAEWSVPERETGYQWDFGMDWRGRLFNSRVRLSATYFGRLTDDQIYPNYEPLYGTINYVNAGVVDAHGMEFEGKFNWSRFDVDASATWQKTLLLKTPMNKRTLLKQGNSLTLQPEWETYVRGSYRLPGKRLSLFAEHHYTGRMLENWVYDINDTNVQRHAMNVTGIGARYKTPWGFALVSGVDDLFDKRSGQKYDRVYGETHVWGAAYPSPGRTWYVTLDYMLGRGSSAADSNGVGSTDSPSAAGKASNFPPVFNPRADGGKASRRRLFYIAPKLVYVNQKADLAGRAVDLGTGNAIVGGNFMYLAPEFAGPQVPYTGTSRSDSYKVGGLALGVDLHDRFDLPFRIEFDASLPREENYIRAVHPGYRKNPDPNVVEMGLYWIGGSSTTVNGLNVSNTSLRYRTHAAFLGLYYDFHNGTRLTPYIGAGTGLSFVKTDGYTIFAGYMRIARPYDPDNFGPFPGNATVNAEEGVRERNFAWNASAGVSYRLTDDFALDVSYRYVNTGFAGRKGVDLERGLNQQAEGLYAGSLTIQRPDLDLRHQHQAVVALRFSF
jgi:outer membrane receptor protein involved in Fe transport/opacity protein-like surface antigen